MRIDIYRGLGILAKDALPAPVTKVASRTRIYIICRIVAGFFATEDNAYQVIRASSVVAILKGGSDLVVRLSDELGNGKWLDVICVSRMSRIAKRAEGMNVGHGKF